MKDLIQYEKAKTKLNIIKNLIKELGNYNAIQNYDNKKSFTLSISYYKNDEKDCYVYTLKVLRGASSQVIMDLKFKYKDKLDDLFNKLLEDLLRDENFKFTSFHTNERGFNTYNINLDNNIMVEFPIYNEDDQNKFELIEKRFKKKHINFNYKISDNNEEIKDEVQKEKAVKSIKIVKSILDSLCKMNNIENYDNSKSYRLIVKNKFIEKDGYNKFNFSIIRGFSPEDTVFDINVSIKDTKVIYEELFDFMVSYLNREDFMLFTTTKPIYGERLNINLKNKVTLEFLYGTETDKKFYDSFFEEFRDDVYKLDHKLIGRKLEINNSTKNFINKINPKK